MSKKAEEELFMQTRQAYANDYGIGISPNDIGRFMTVFSNESDPNDQAPLDYSNMYCELNFFDRLSDEHNKTILDLGKRAARISRYQAVEGETFGWGYNLYLSILTENDIQRWRPHSFRQLVSDPIFTGSIDEAVQKLAAEAATNTGLLFDVADDLLDGIIEKFNDECDCEEDDDGEFERDSIRQERLLVMRAGIGLAFRHWQENTAL